MSYNIDWNAVSATGTCLGALATFGACLIALWQTKKSINIQSKINLYEMRYKKIYKLILDTIEAEQKLYMIKYDVNEQEKIATRFYSEFDFARFLISEKDFKNIISIHNEIAKALISFFSKYASLQGKDRFTTEEEKNLVQQKIKDVSKLSNDIEIKKQEILNIIIPYLQIV